MELFKILDTPIENRSPYLDDTLKKFPYVDGGLFADEIDFPNFTPEIKNLLLDEAGGMHYTSTENMHKVINPLFMDELRSEFETI